MKMRIEPSSPTGTIAMFALTWPTLTLVTEVAGSAPAGVGDGVTDKNVGWLPGALFGGAFIMFVPNIAEELSKGLSGAVYGVIMILMMYAIPTGLGGLLKVALGALSKRSTTR